MHLYAKSRWRDGRQKRLSDHSRETMDAFEYLFGTDSKPTRLAREWLKFFRIPREEYPRFHATSLAACGLHDLGKANSGFVGMLERGGEQVIRHEHLSTLLLMSRGVESWLTTGSAVDFDVVLAAVGGHHLKSARQKHPRGLYRAFGDPDSATLRAFLVHTESEDFAAIFEQVRQRLGLATPFEPAVEQVWSYDENVGQDVTELQTGVRSRFASIHRALLSDALPKQFLAAVKAAVIVADTAASGVVRENLPLRDWIGAAFADENVLDVQKIDEIIEKRKREINKKRDKQFVWHSFQENAELLGSRALLLAGCGSGKTLAAWRWIKARIAERPVSRVLFLYPTRGTATEGFRDYVSWAPESDGALLHGTSRFDLEGMFANPDDPRKDNCYEPNDRLFAVGYWEKRAFSATVDQFLGFMRQGYRSICLLPLLADSVVVIDEVHSFDHDLFATLKRFLRSFDVPVLCMTASLTRRRREDLKELGLEIYPRDIGQFKDLEKKMTDPRYLVRTLPGAKEAIEIALDRYGSGKKRVLIVVNTIARCQSLARKLGALCYHSGFKLEDRRDRHSDVVEAFQQKGKPALAVTTQVCEMSLDLDADVLITEAAPISSLIQRMGRCNRHGEIEFGEVFIYHPKARAPYTDNDLTGVTQFVEAVDGKQVSQTLLEELLALGPKHPELERYERFLDDGPWAAGGYDDLRDIDESGVRAILDQDINSYKLLLKEHKPTDGLILSIRRDFTREEPSLGWVRVADSSRYRTQYGFWVAEALP